MSTTQPIRIILADDHAFFRLGFRKVMEIQDWQEIEFIEEAANGVDLIEKVTLLQPDLVITDIRMPEMDGTEACRYICSHYPKIGVIAFSAFDNQSYIFNMLEAGAKGYLVKDSTKEEVLQCIRTVQMGLPFYCSSIAEKIYGIGLNSREKIPEKVYFAPHELNVIRLICKQLSTKEISVKLNLSARTVEDYRYHIQEKIGAKNMVGVALYAIFHGIVKYGEF
jgi:DNA-binding NarL/FixJ family response regulator